MSKASVLQSVPAVDRDIDVGRSVSDRQAVAEILSEVTIQTYRTLLRSQVVHWNITGPLFAAVHALTEQHYTDLFGAIDALAERIRALGFPVPTGKASSGLDKALSLGAKMTPKSLIEDLVEDHEQLVRLIRDGATLAGERDDFVSRDLLTARLAVHEKAIWVLRAIIAD